MQRKSSLSKPTTHTSADHPPLLGLRGSTRGERMEMINQGLQEMLNVCGPAEPGVAAVCSEDLGGRLLVVR